MNYGKYIRGEDQHIGTARTKLTPLEQLAMLEHQNRDPRTDYKHWSRDELVSEVIRLRLRVDKLEKDNFEMSWQLYPESMGR